MNTYKFEKDNGIYRWTDGTIKVEFSDPHIQTFREIVNLTNPKNIMHLYYDIEVSYKGYNKRWKRLLYKYVYDFPALLNLIDILDECLRDNKNNLSCKRSFIEDFYEIKYTQRDDEQLYTLTIGATPEGMYHTVTNNISIDFLTKEEIEEFAKTVKGFLEYAMKCYSDSAKQRENFERSNKVIRNGKLYVSNLDCENNIYLDDVLLVGDLISDLHIFVPTKDNLSFCEEDYRNLVIEKFDEDNQIVFFDDGESYKCSEIASIFMKEPTSKLHYGVEEIASDFYGIMSNNEKEEFKTETEDVLFAKYCWLIICRSWMCRSEHDFDKKYPELLNIKDSGNHERTFEVVRMVIRKLKEMC